jgi:hypothetical protein
MSPEGLSTPSLNTALQMRKFNILFKLLPITVSVLINDYFIIIIIIIIIINNSVHYLTNYLTNK